MCLFQETFFVRLPVNLPNSFLSMGAGQQSSLTQIFIQDSLNAMSLHAAVLLKGDVTVQLFKQFLFENDNWVYAGESVCCITAEEEYTEAFPLTWI